MSGSGAFMTSGAVSIPHGHRVANVNRPTDNDVDVVAGTVHHSGIPVSLRPA